MILFINTTDLNNVVFQLRQPKSRAVVSEYKTRLEYNKTSDMLKHLTKFLKQQYIYPLSKRGENVKTRETEHSKLTAISVVAGKGSFSGIRVGVSIAQALSLACGVSLKVIKK